MKITLTTDEFHELARGDRCREERMQDLQKQVNDSWLVRDRQEREIQDLKIELSNMRTSVPSARSAVLIANDLRDLLTGVNTFNKINTIKAVRSLSGMGLKEAKDFVEMNTPRLFPAPPGC